jgi:hypothetical protein
VNERAPDAVPPTRLLELLLSESCFLSFASPTLFDFAFFELEFSSPFLGYFFD